MDQWIPHNPETAASRIAELREMSRIELKHFFRELDAPSLRELDGEFATELLAQGTWLQSRLTHMLFGIYGTWLGKSFQPLDENEGHGHNNFHRRGVVHQRLQMRTYVGPSRLDAGQSYFLDYSPFNRGLIGTMVDEIRRIERGVYLGIGMIGPTKKLRRKMPFLLTGPIREFANRAA